MIPRFRPMIGAGEISALFRSTRGSVEDFEGEFATRFGAADALAFPYGRSGLWAMFNALGLHDAEVIVPPYTCSVVAHAVTLSGNQPRYVDITLADYNMDLEQLPEAINERTRAIVATHIFGYPLDVDRLGEIVADAERRFGHKIWVIQDCAHSFDATWNGRPVAREGDTALYGLNASKIITSIFGGMLTVQDAELGRRLREWRDANFNRPAGSKSALRRLYLLAAYFAFSDTLYGFNWWLQNRTRLLDSLTKDYHLDDKIHFPPDYLDRMLDVEAAVGLVQLKRYDEIIQLRRDNASWYHRNLPRREDWVLPPEVDGATYSHYVVRTRKRDDLIERCAKHGIELGRVIDYSIPELQSYRTEEQFPNSAEASRSAVNLPLTIRPDQRPRVLAALQEAAR